MDRERFSFPFLFKFEIKYQAMIKYLIFTLVVMLMLGCGTPTPMQNKNHQTTKISEITLNDLFNEKKVFQFAEYVKHSEESDKLFLKGIDLLKNKKDFINSIGQFEASILKSPSGKAYYEMGNAYMETKNYQKAIQSFELAEKLGYEPFSKILYNISCAYSLMNKVDFSGEYLELALQAGYSNIEHINYDPDLKNLRNSFKFHSHLKNGLNGMSETELLFWLQYKRIYKKTNLPLILNEKSAIEYSSEENLISYDFEKYIPEMRDSEFSRDVSNGYYQIALLNETAKYIAIIYMEKNLFMDDYAPPVFRLVTYTLKGKMIDKKEIAGQSDLTKAFKVCSIKEDLQIEIKNYQLIYEKDVNENGYYENPVIERKFLNSSNFEIDEKGNIITKNSLSKVS